MNFNYSYNLTEEAGGLKFLFNNLGVYLPYSIFAAMGAVFGTFGNLLIMAAILCTKELLKTTKNAIIFNLALSDLIISAIVDSFTIVGVFWGEAFFNGRPALCQFVAFCCVTSCMCSLSSMGLIAFNRYVFICHRHYYKKIFTKFKTFVYCLLCWSSGIFTEVGAIGFIGWNADYFDKKTLVCNWNRLANRVYSLILMAVSICVPSVLISFFYLKIYLYALSVRSRVRSRQSLSELKRSIRIAKGLFSSFFVFLVCWLPYAVIIMIDSEDKWSNEVYVYSMLFAILNSTLNPIFYALTNPNYQRGFMNVFSLICCHKIDSKQRTKDSEKRTTTQNEKTEKKTRNDLKLEIIEINIAQKDE